MLSITALGIPLTIQDIPHFLVPNLRNPLNLQKKRFPQRGMVSFNASC
jgi:hypothetical protein